MNKYTKMALVLLYLLQLVVVFREQLAHLYRSAIESVHHQTDQAAAHPGNGGLRGVFARVVKVARPVTRETMLAATAMVPAAVMNEHADDDADNHHHDDDDKKDRAKRQRRTAVREYLIRNLYPAMKRSAAAPSARTKRANDILRVLVFATTTSPAANA